jgi:hypothetical protein
MINLKKRETLKIVTELIFLTIEAYSWSEKGYKNFI